MIQSIFIEENLSDVQVRVINSEQHTREVYLQSLLNGIKKNPSINLVDCLIEGIELYIHK